MAIKIRKRTPSDAEVMERAAAILLREMVHREVLSAPAAVRDYLRHLMGTQEREVFACLFLDSQNRLLDAEVLFTGTLAQTSVFPREVVKAALLRNAAAVIFAHNHPSGVAEPSCADMMITQALKQALALVDVKVLDHFVVTAGACLSFAERGIL